MFSCTLPSRPFVQFELRRPSLLAGRVKERDTGIWTNTNLPTKIADVESGLHLFIKMSATDLTASLVDVIIRPTELITLGVVGQRLR